MHRHTLAEKFQAFKLKKIENTAISAAKKVFTCLKLLPGLNEVLRDSILSCIVHWLKGYAGRMVEPKRFIRR